MFVITILITGITALIFYKTRYVNYLNVISSALVSIFVGFVISLVPTKGAGDKKKHK
ncbi:probable membrane protein [Clostridium botulinum BKT015925]|nr:probable membrane protein [Clostridium botulinum BKT015925]